MRGRSSVSSSSRRKLNTKPSASASPSATRNAPTASASTARRFQRRHLRWHGRLRPRSPPRFQMTVPVFEEVVRDGLVEEKFRKLITDGISVGPAEIQEEFHYQNEKVKLDYVLDQAGRPAGQVTLDEIEIKAYYDQNKRQVPDSRKARRPLRPGRYQLRFARTPR